MSENKDIRVGDIWMASANVWVVSSVYIETLPAKNHLGLRRPGDGTALERAFVFIDQVDMRHIYRAVGT